MHLTEASLEEDKVRRVEEQTFEMILCCETCTLWKMKALHAFQSSQINRHGTARDKPIKRCHYSKLSTNEERSPCHTPLSL